MNMNKTKKYSPSNTVNLNRGNIDKFLNIKRAEEEEEKEEEKEEEEEEEEREGEGLCFEDYQKTPEEEEENEIEIEMNPDISRFQNKKGRLRDKRNIDIYWPTEDATQHHLMAWAVCVKAPEPFQSRFKTYQYAGGNGSESLMKHLKQIKAEIHSIIKDEQIKEVPVLTEEEEKSYKDDATPCHICNKMITLKLSKEEEDEIKMQREERTEEIFTAVNYTGLDQLGYSVIDHDHFTGKKLKLNILILKYIFRKV